MTIILGVMVVLSFVLGCLLTNIAAARSHGRELAAAYAGGRRSQRAVDIAKLSQLRRELEENDLGEDGDGGLLTGDVFLLYDICQALRLSEGETQHILGASYLLLIEAPVMVWDEWANE